MAASATPRVSGLPTGFHGPWGARLDAPGRRPIFCPGAPRAGPRDACRPTDFRATTALVDVMVKKHQAHSGLYPQFTRPAYAKNIAVSFSTASSGTPAEPRAG